MAKFMMALLYTLEFLGLGLWLGSDAFLSFVVAPGAFRVLAGRDQAGAIVGFSLAGMHWLGIVCGVLVLLARLLRTRSLGGLAAPAAGCIVLMITLTAISQTFVSPRMADLRLRMGSIQASAADSPLLAEFGQLHRVSVSLEGGVLLTGLLCMFFMVRELLGSR